MKFFCLQVFFTFYMFHSPFSWVSQLISLCLTNVYHCKCTIEGFLRTFFVGCSLACPGSLLVEHLYSTTLFTTSLEERCFGGCSLFLLVLPQPTVYTIHCRYEEGWRIDFVTSMHVFKAKSDSTGRTTSPEIVTLQTGVRGCNRLKRK